MKQLEITITKIIYSQPNCYVAMCSSDDPKSDEFKVVNGTVEWVIGKKYTILGEMKSSPKYGDYISVNSCIPKIERKASEIEKYLSGNDVFGIGEVYAKRIVDRFGDATLDIIENSPEEILKVDGIGRARAQRVIDGCRKDSLMMDVKLFLNGLGITGKMAEKIIDRYGENSIAVIESNPYQMIMDIKGIDFKTADAVAQKIGIKEDSPFRIKAAIMHIVNSNTSYGHTYVKAGKIKNDVENMLGNVAEEKEVYGYIDELETENRLSFYQIPKGVLNDDYPIKAVLLKEAYTAENEIANKLIRLSNKTGQTIKTRSFIRSRCEGLDEEQICAVEKAVTNKVSIISGGPGTGKTTITKTIIDIFEYFGKKVLLAAPTGKASKHLEQVTGKQAVTIHRLLECSPKEGFLKNEENQISGDVLILDECSMIDIYLMRSLLRAVPDEMILIMVGDENQLPSIDPGAVFWDIKESDIFPSFNLNKIYRQGKGSQIAVAAQKIKDIKEDEVLPNSLRGDLETEFSGFEAGTSEDIPKGIIAAVNKIVRKGYGSADEIQVLCFQKESSSGTKELNKQLQKALNDTDIVCTYGEKEFRINDRVMQQQNNYDKNVFNGEVGYVSSYDFENDILYIQYEDKCIPYEHFELEEIDLAYAITIHKSQGSEFPIVIIPLDENHNKALMKREVLYTGVTRASEKLVFVGMVDVLKEVVKEKKSRRNTLLKLLLKQKKENEVWLWF